MSLSVTVKRALAVALGVDGDALATAIDDDGNALPDGQIYVGSAAGVAAKKTPNGDVTMDREGVTTIGDQKLDGRHAKNIAAANIIGGLPELFRIDIAAGALGNTDVITTHKIRVIDAYLILRSAGVATTTLQVKNGANAISSLMAASGADQALVRTTSIDDANWEIVAGGTLRVTSATGATQPDATVYVLAHRIP